jgi:hypothetical protein
LSGYPQCDEEVRKLADELWGDCDGKTKTEQAAGQGRVIWESGSAANPPPDASRLLERARWIWSAEGNPAAAAAVCKRYFWASVEVGTGVEVDSARVVMTADNGFELWINGRQVGVGDNFKRAYVFDVAPFLKQGRNVVAVAAENGASTPNPAGLIGTLLIRCRDGRELELHTDSQWRAAATVSDNWMTSPTDGAPWSRAMDLGPMGMAPWGRVGGSSPQPEMFCDFKVVTRLLGRMGAPPDFESDGPLRFIHRRTREADIYFVANREERRVEANCLFRVVGRAPELWDPLTGEMSELPEFASADGRTRVPMRFEAAQSFFVIFRKPGREAQVVRRNFPEANTVAELSGPWEVSFDPKWGGPEKVTFVSLGDWSKRAESGIKYYSGTAVYRKTFDLPEALAAQVGQGGKLYLDLGTIRNLAQVRLNGRDLGVVWCAPWRVEISSAVKPRDNQVEVAVVNLWPNRLIGDKALPSAQRLTWTTWNPFTKDTPLLESGLLGPVTIRALGQAR